MSLLSDQLGGLSLDQQKKGDAVRRQLTQWEQLMRLQIKVHSAIRAFNQLPRDEKAKELLAKADEETKRNYNAVRRNAVKMVETLLEAEDSLLSGSMQTNSILKGKVEGHDSDDEEIESSEDEKEEEAEDDAEDDADESGEEDLEDEDGEDNEEDDDDLGESDDEEAVDAAETKKKKKASHGRSSRSHLSALLAKRDKRFETFRNATLKKWDERTRLTTAKSAKNAKKDFSAFDSSILTQLQKILADRNRLIQRTQTKRSDVERIGGDPEATHDVELFDDDDFYQSLLKELIDRKSTQTSDPIEMSRQWLELQKLREKRSKKRVVDTKASKGRKIRYVTIPKLVNFHPAMPENFWEHEKRNELFKSLFA